MATQGKQTPVLTTPPVQAPWVKAPAAATAPATPAPVAKTQAQIDEEARQLLAQWFDAQNKLEELKATELNLRNKIVGLYWGSPENLAEGVNKKDMPEGWVLKATGKLNRKVDEAAIPAVAQQLATMGVSIDAVIKYKPDLKTTQYRELTAEQRKVFDQALIITPGTPQLELTKPKR